MKNTMKTNITEDHKAAFEAVRTSDGVCLVSCFVDGRPSAAICLATSEPDGSVVVAPLFVAVDDLTEITDHEGKSPKQ